MSKTFYKNRSNHLSSHSLLSLFAISGAHRSRGSMWRDGLDVMMPDCESPRAGEM